MHKNNKAMGRGKGGSSSKPTSTLTDSKGNEIDIQKLLKDIEFLGSSRMTWKERKELENRKVVSLGGKPPKKPRVPLSVARVSMKKQKDKGERVLEEGMVLGRFGGRSEGSLNRVAAERRKVEDRVLRSSEGHFSKGVLDVKHLLKQDKYGDTNGGSSGSGSWVMPMGGGTKKKGSKNTGKKKGKKGGKKRR